MSVVGFLISSRPTAILFLQRDHVQLSSTEITPQLHSLNYSETWSAPCIAVHILVSSHPSERIATVSYRLLQATRVPYSYLFARYHSLPLPASRFRSSMIAVLSRSLSPAGTRWTSHALRRGGISAAYSVDLGLPSFMRLPKNTSAEVIHNHCLGALLPPSAAARFFLWRFTPVSEF